MKKDNNITLIAPIVGKLAHNKRVTLFDWTTGEPCDYVIVASGLKKTISNELLLREYDTNKFIKETMIIRDGDYGPHVTERQEYHLFADAKEACMAALRLGCDLDPESLKETFTWALDAIELEMRSKNELTPDASDDISASDTDEK